MRGSCVRAVLVCSLDSVSLVMKYLVAGANSRAREAYSRGPTSA